MEERLDKGTIVEIVRSIKVRCGDHQTALQGERRRAEGLPGHCEQEYDAREGHRTEFQRTPRDCYAFNIFRMINVSVMREQEVRELVAKVRRRHAPTALHCATELVHVRCNRRPKG
eukprot:scaffold4990_cov387-Prasinococcus_capsulatus_cf.AAC.43